jgi:hypothetical protein
MLSLAEHFPAGTITLLATDKQFGYARSTSRTPPSSSNMSTTEYHMLQFHIIANITKQMLDRFLPTHVRNTNFALQIIGVGYGQIELLQ